MYSHIQSKQKEPWGCSTWLLFENNYSTNRRMFDVTLDELVGMDEIKNIARVEVVFKKLKENASVGKVEKRKVTKFF
jgi:hypothetical protein